jgi:hypothetical protein
MVAPIKVPTAVAAILPFPLPILEPMTAPVAAPMSVPSKSLSLADAFSGLIPMIINITANMPTIFVFILLLLNPMTGNPLFATASVMQGPGLFFQIMSKMIGDIECAL